MSHEAPMASRPAVEPALVTRAQRALCTILVAATLGVALTLFSAAPAAAARHARAPKSHILTVSELVSACAVWAHNYEPGFGAYWDESTQQAHLYRIPNGAGTFQFDRCMAAPRPGYPHGFPLNDVAGIDLAVAAPRPRLRCRYATAPRRELYVGRRPERDVYVRVEHRARAREQRGTEHLERRRLGARDRARDEHLRDGLLSRVV
jgi:hypothetical protein